MTFRFTTAGAFCLVTSAIALVPAAVAAQPAPTWLEAPTVAEVVTAYPAKAKAAGAGGVVDLTCTIDREGRARSCAVLKETPSGYAFGAAARKLAQQMRVKELDLRGHDVLVPVTFNPDILKAAPLELTRPMWTAMPSAADFQATFPKTANGVNSVRVVLACTVEAGGALASCQIDSEDPAGQGYGEGALALASKFQVGPWSQDGQPTAGSTLRLPIRYELTQAAAQP